MDIKVLDGSYNVIAVLDSIESIIWKEAYNGLGDFEIYTKYNTNIENILRLDYFLQIPDSERTMVIEDSEIKTDPENGDKLVITGRSLESILDRRIVLRQTRIDTTLAAGILQIINDNIVTPIWPERTISNFLWTYPANATLEAITLKTQLYGETLLDAIYNICNQAGVGFRLFLNASNQLDFKLYLGTDRSYTQTTNPQITFSPEFDNLISSSYLTSNRIKKNYILITGNAPSAFPGYPYRQQWWKNNVNTTGLIRREVGIDATDIPLNVYDSPDEISETEYMAQLLQRGKEVLATYDAVNVFDGEIRVNVDAYKYGVDYFLGDIVEIKDNYGHTGRVRINEMTVSENPSERSIYPTLENV
jgi:hypothetical protein